MKNQPPPQDPSSRRKPFKEDDNNWMRYTSIAGQIVVTMLAGIALGYFLDKYINLGFPVFKLVCSFGAVIVALYLFIKEVSGKK